LALQGAENGAQNVFGSTMDELLAKFRNQVVELFRHLRDLECFKGSQELPKFNRKFLDEALHNKLDSSDWKHALFKLTGLLHNLRKRRVVVLVDEYDTPILHAMQHQYFKEVRTPPMALLRA
jgi:hypothetical protein